MAASLCPAAGPFAPLLFAGRLEEGIRTLAELHYDAVELSVREAGEVDEHWLKDRLAAHGIGVSVIATGRMYYEQGISLSAPDPALRATCRERLIGLAHLAHRLNAGLLLGGVRGVLPRDSRAPELRAAAATVLKQVVDEASALGVPVLVEPINRYETNYLNTAAETLAFLAEAGTPQVRLLLDTFHMNIEEVSISAALQLAGERLAYVHLADSNRRAPSCGHTDFAAVVRTLNEMHFQGFIGMEILPWPDDREAARLGIANARQLCAAGKNSLS